MQPHASVGLGVVVELGGACQAPELGQADGDSGLARQLGLEATADAGGLGVGGVGADVGVAGVLD